MLFAWLLACTNSPSTNDSATVGSEATTCFDATPSIEMGEGERTFELFEEPYESMMIHGPQGGWHILASLQIHGMMDIVEVQYTIEHLATGVLVSDNNYRLAVISEGDCTGYYPGMYGYLSVSPLYDGELDTPPEILGGERLRIQFRVNDCNPNQEAVGDCVRDERWVETALEVLATLDPVDVVEDAEDTAN